MIPEIKPEQHERILRQIAELESVSFDELKRRWRSLIGTEPPTHNRPFLVKRMAYRIQEQVYGGLSENAKERLAEVAERYGIDEDGRIARRPKRGESDRPVVGTRFIREWRGKRYEVTVTTTGYEYGGKPYRSLSAIAKAITGTQWNGKVFFGLKSQRGGAR